MHVVFPALLKFGDVGLLLLRLMVAVVFFASGVNHLKDPVARSHSIGMSRRFTVFLGTAELLGSTGVALGILTQLAAIAAYAALLAVWGWRPFLPKTDAGALAQQLTAAHLVPLASLSGRVDVFSALHVAQQCLLYLPLGSVLAVWPLRRPPHLWPAVWLAVGIELGHIVIAERFFDVTNALVACAGLGIGWLVVQRSGFTPHAEASARGTS